MPFFCLTAFPVLSNQSHDVLISLLARTKQAKQQVKVLNPSTQQMQSTDNSTKAWVLEPHPTILNLRYSETRHRDNSTRIKYPDLHTFSYSSRFKSFRNAPVSPQLCFARVTGGIYLTVYMLHSDLSRTTRRSQQSMPQCKLTWARWCQTSRCLQSCRRCS